MTNQGQPCASWKHVSLWDFFPLVIILITASLSSNTYNKSSWCENWTFWNTVNIIQNVEHSSRLHLRVTCVTANNGFRRSIMTLSRVSKDCNKTIRSHNSRAGIPSNLNPASKEMISDSVELCETEVCFLHIQLIGTNVWLQKSKVLPEVDFESSRSPCKIGVLKQSQHAFFLQYYPHDNTTSNELIVKLWSIL